MDSNCLNGEEKTSITEAKDSIIKILKSSRSYNRILADLRAAVYTSVIEDERSHGVHCENLLLRDFVQAANNEISTGIVMDYLATLGLNKTLSVLEAELGEASYYDRKSLETLFGVEGGYNQPLISHFFVDSVVNSSSQNIHSTDKEQKPMTNDKTSTVDMKQANGQMDKDLKMISTSHSHSSINDQFTQQLTGDLFNVRK